MFSAPRQTAPASCQRATANASFAAGARRCSILLPARVTVPVISNRFFAANGTPASMPGSSPRAIFASTAAASASARVSVTSVKAFTSALRDAMRASADFATSVAESVRWRTSRASSVADIVCSSVME